MTESERSHRGLGERDAEEGVHRLAELRHVEPNASDAPVLRRYRQVVPGRFAQHRVNVEEGQEQNVDDRTFPSFPEHREF